MKKKILFCFILLCAVFLPYFVSSVIPLALDTIHQKKMYWQADLTVKQVKIGNDIFEYAEGGKGETVVLLHGFQSDKKAMIPFAKVLMHKFHVILPDLSGHGGSSQHLNQHYDIYSLAKDIDRLIAKLNINNFHFVGTSTGGGVAVCCSLNNSYVVKSITLVNPLGVKPPINSFFQDNLEKGRNMLFPSTLKEVDDLGYVLIGKPLSLSMYLKRYVLSVLLSQRDFFQKAFVELIDSKPLDSELKNVKLPVLIIGGKEDKVLHYTSYEVFHKNIKNSKCVILENATHVLVGEAQDKANNLLLDFVLNNN